MNTYIPIGTKVNFLTITSNQFKKGRNYFFKCKCVCGKEIDAPSHKIRTLKAMSCGCRIILNPVSKHPLNNIYYLIKARCYCVTNRHYHRYGARGIIMSEEWKNSFTQFCIDIGERPSPKHSIDRIDNDKGYSKENCRWATQKEQTNNTTRTRYFEYKGKRMKLDDLEKISVVDRVVLWHRMVTYGWDIERAISTPNRCKPRKKKLDEMKSKPQNN